MSVCQVLVAVGWFAGCIWMMVALVLEERAYFARVRALRGLTEKEFPLSGEPSHPLTADWPRQQFLVGLRLAWNRFLLIIRAQPEPELNRLRSRVLRPVYYAFTFTIV